MQHHVHRSLRRSLIVAVLVALGTALAPAAAYADGWRTATSSGWGPSWSAGSTNAQNNARAALAAQAGQAGETCTSVTSSATHVYTAPDGSAYVFNGTATGYCAVTPPSPYTVARSATRQGGGSSSSAGQSAAYQLARADVLAAGIDCTGWTVSYAHVYTAPGGAWYIYNATVNALCTN